MLLRYLFCLMAIPNLLLAQTYQVQLVAGADHAKEGPGLSVLLRNPRDIVSGRDGAFYVSDLQDGRIRRIAPDFTIATVAGNGICCFGGDGGPALQARLGSPAGLAFDGGRNRLYIADETNGRVRAVDLDTGIISTVAGNGGLVYSPANENKIATEASIKPLWLATDSAGNLFVSDLDNGRVYRIDAITKILRTIAGSGLPEREDEFNTDGKPAIAVPLSPKGIAVSGNFVVFMDNFSSNLRSVDLSSGIIRTIVRTYGREPGGFQRSSSFRFGKPLGSGSGSGIGSILLPVTAFRLAFNFFTNESIDLSYVLNYFEFINTRKPTFDVSSSSYYDLIHVLAINGANMLTLGNAQQVNRIVNGQLVPVAGVGRPLARDTPFDTYLQSPAGISFTRSGELMIADYANATLRVIDVAGSSIRIASAFLQYRDSNPYPEAVVERASGEVIFVADNRVMLSDPIGYPTSLAGSEAGFSGDGGSPEKARLSRPTGIATLPDGSILVADYGNSRVRRISADRKNISTVVGDGSTVFRPGAAPTATGLAPYDLATGPGGSVYITDHQNHRVYRFDPLRQSIESIAGTGVQGYSGDGGPAVTARLNQPTGLAVSRTGEIFVADRGNARVRRISPGGVIRTVAGNGRILSTGDGGPALDAGMVPFRLAVGPDDAIYFSDTDHHRIRRLVQSAPADVISIIQGDNQTARLNTPLPESLRVSLRTAGGLPIANAPVQFSTVSGRLLLIEADSRTDAEGSASARVLALAAGPAALHVSSPTSDGVTFNFAVSSAAGPVPQVSIASVFGAGLSVNTLAPLGLGTVFGEAFAADGVNRDSVNEDLMDGRLPLTSGGVCLEINSIPTPLLAVSPTRIDFQTPLLSPSRSVLFQIVRDCGGPLETRSAPIGIEIRKASPELATWTSGPGSRPVRAIDTETGALIGPATLGLGYKLARPGKGLTLFATGLGLVNPTVAAGEFAPEAAVVSAVINLRIGDRLVPATAALVPKAIGIYSVQLSLPTDLLAGEHSIQLIADGVGSPSGPLLAVAEP